MGPPAGLPVAPTDGPIRFETPVTVEVAAEAKCIMTEHGKARRNRLRDLQAFHSYAHNYNNQTVAAGTIAVNISPIFWSPLRDENDITAHDNIATLGADTIGLFRSLPLRHRPEEGGGLEAVSVIVVSFDNLAKNPTPPLGAPTPHAPKLVTQAPAPQVGDPMHYATMIRRMCSAYRERWSD